MGQREGAEYRLAAGERERFESEGWVHLAGVLDESELREIEVVYERFLRREIAVPGRDFCDMSADYERRAASIAAQLCGPGMELDYDQLVAKRPRKDDAVFHWHQDLAYWPVTDDSRTASFWLALDDTSEANGCLRFVSGSHREARLREHRPVLGDRSKSHTLVAQVDEARERIVSAQIRRGDVTVHSERTIHGSAGNRTSGWRRGYVVAFRSRATIEAERRAGFTHSHNDRIEVLEQVGREPG
jgi:ectoine hydroxylase-related dioxygenase (phytanoyl-CoA dioxygenase family)